MFKTIYILVMLICLSMLAFAQEPIEPHDTSKLLYQNGQIYLVVLVLFTIFVGIIFYLIKLDKKITTLEKNSNH